MSILPSGSIIGIMVLDSYRSPNHFARLCFTTLPDLLFVNFQDIIPILSVHTSPRKYHWHYGPCSMLSSYSFHWLSLCPLYGPDYTMRSTIGIVLYLVPSSLSVSCISDPGVLCYLPDFMMDVSEVFYSSSLP